IAERRPYTSMEDLVRRTGATLPAIEALSTAGAFGSLELQRREALWSAGAVAQTADTKLEGVVCGTDAPTLPEMSAPEVTAADLWATGVAPDSHVVEFARPQLDAAGADTVAGLEKVPSARRVSVGGVVTHRQRPATANGTIFINLEDETGMLNVICNAAVWDVHRRVARSSPALLIRGRLERAEGVTNLIAEKIESLSLSTSTPKSRDFR
ncbi:MAG TPA: OB-fold nucleic acid binding domain-containing protein, partial [Acidimicrobiales bacterium]|nr:OB-fold nucleic acid binding domain-containing protein [Acidimicrobiales bacterium]